MAGAQGVMVKAGAAAAVAGGGVLLLAGSASAQEAPEIPAWLQELGQQVFTEYGPQILEAQQQVDQFVQSLKPADDPSTAEVTATPESSSGTAWQDESGDFVLGRSEATPTGARVTILRAFGYDILTREGDEHGGTYGGVAPWLGGAIDWVNERTCPSGVHGGEDICITFLDSSATTRTVSDQQEVTQDLPLAPIIGGFLPTDAQIDGLPSFLVNSTRKAQLKQARADYLASLSGQSVQATGVSEGTSTDNDASFHLFKGSWGADSLTLLPTSAGSSSIQLGPGPLTTSAFQVANPFRPILTAVLGSGTANTIFGLLPNVFPANLDVPEQTVQFPGSPRVCSSSASANTVAGTGIFADLAGFLGTPKDAFDLDECELIEMVEPTSGN